jgi:hypothetical protein
MHAWLPSAAAGDLAIDHLFDLHRRRILLPGVCDRGSRRVDRDCAAPRQSRPLPAVKPPGGDPGGMSAARGSIFGRVERDLTCGDNDWRNHE